MRSVSPDEQKRESLRYIATQLRMPRSIERIVGFAGSQAMGDFLMEHVFYATVAHMAGCRDLTVIYRDDRPYKKVIAALNRQATRHVSYSAPGDAFPIDWFDIGYNAPLVAPMPRWYDDFTFMPDLVMTPSMVFNTAFLKEHAGLAFAAEDVGRLTPALAAAGVPEGRWFVGLHVRESRYAFRDNIDPSRSSDPNTFLDAIRVIRDVGGYVVRIGDEAQSPLPAMDGLVDLSRIPGSFELQAFAFSQARFNLVTDSGPAALSSALRVPTVATNSFTREAVFNPADLVLLKRVRLRGVGEVEYGGPEYLANGWPDLDLRFIQAAKAPELDGSAIEGFAPNTPEQICEVVGMALEDTAGFEGWRPTPAPLPAREARKLAWPFDMAPPQARVWTPNGPA